MSIYLFSRPIHSGKTTALLHWCRNRSGIAGIAMPDIDGSRKILDLTSRTVFPVQCSEPGQSLEPLINIGKYHFYASAFEKANSILLEALEQEYDWLVIDEVGKLELEQKGFYPAVQKAVEQHLNNDQQANLLLTVRESLTQEVIRYFGIHHCTVVTDPEALPSPA